MLEYHSETFRKRHMNSDMNLVCFGFCWTDFGMCSLLGMTCYCLELLVSFGMNWIFGMIWIFFGISCNDSVLLG